MGSDGSPRPGPPPGVAGDEDLEWAQYVAWVDREVAAGRVPEPEPEPWALDEGEPWNLEPDDPDLAWPGPASPVPSGRPAAGPERPLFAEDGAGDVMPPSAFLAALTEMAVSDVASLSDNELVGVLRASQRLMAREQYKQVLAAAEFGRRRQAAFEGALARGVPAGCAAGGFPGEELAAELVITRAGAGHLIDDAIDLTSRLPRTLAGMAAGLVDAGRAEWIALYTRSLNPADAARADEVLAGEAPELRSEQLARKAAALEMRLNPEAVRARRERAKRDGQRVEARREASGNASLAGRELDTADVLASKAYLDAVAVRLREGRVPGSLDRLRALAMTDLTQGRDPLDRITPAPAPDTGGPAPIPALVNLLIPAGTLLSLSTTPAQAGAWGLLDADDTRAVTAAAAAHPRTRWCLTVTGPDGTAIAHGCARGPRPRLLDDLTPAPAPSRPGGPARRAAVPPQPHPHPRHTRQLRPRRARGRRLRPQPRTQAPGPRPHFDL